MGKLSRLAALVVIGLAVLALTGCGDDDDEAAGDDATTVELAAVGDSGQSGTATLMPTDDQTQTSVVVEVDDPVSASQPAHIHEGTCYDLNPAPAYGLPNVVDGRSETTVDASFDDLTGGTYAINLHMSDADLMVYTSCGNIEP
jgi:hypothetical protein